MSPIDPSSSALPLPPFALEAKDLLALAQLILSRRPRLAKLAFREQFEVRALGEHGFTTGAQARASLERISNIAGALLLQAHEREPGNAEVLVELGELYLEGKKLEAALECLQGAERIATGKRSATLLARTLLQLERAEEALELWSRSTAIPNEQLVATALYPFAQWCERAEARLVHCNVPQPATVTLNCVSSAELIRVEHRAQVTPLRVAELDDLQIDDIVPQKNGCAYFYEQGLPNLGTRVLLLADAAYLRRALPEGDIVEEPCIFLSGVGWHYQNYYHFVVQNAARLALLLSLPQYRDHRIAVPKLIRSWGLSFLQEMGVEPGRVVVLPAARTSLLRHAVVPEMRGVPSSEEMELLRSRLKVDRSFPGTRRLFVGRSGNHAHSRLLLNEAEILAIAHEFGFEEVDPAGMSIREQITLFNQAQAICGPNGAAFANMLYMPDGAKVICLSPRETIGTWYPDLAAMCGHLYYWCFGSFLEETRGSSMLPQMPYSIPADGFRMALEAAFGPEIPSPHPTLEGNA